ncbi:hypothetical protein HYH03_008756 [Edaphochlamys debaryana]|uniref:Uncharacterized protein n=1 Tax=Edaphochlamys debaryana TaxID=47281 RepID=A0A836BZ68_9CHLO|nr:hypothetical protein HYH03_008756 [Edaphochlamys debaryana]|eukprot:KAG2493093.1 hypothetical protein HYH03_008756 [Edaphochlamys debaryana]
MKFVPQNLLVRPHPVSPPSTDGGAAAGNWTYRCTLTLSNASLAQAAVPGQPLDTNNSAAPPPAPPPNLVLRCEERSPSPAGALTAGLGASLAAGPVAVEGVSLDASLRVAKPGAGAADWGLTLSGSGNLLIEDSALTDLPLSPVAPLLHVIGFAHVTLRNVSVSRLTGAPVLFTGGTPIGPEVQMHGPVALDVTSSASVVDCDCTNIVNAHGWSCFAARMQPQPSAQLNGTAVPPTLVFRMEGTVVDTVTASWMSPDTACPVAGMAGTGMGAVVLNNTLGAISAKVTDSWVKDVTGGCGAAVAAMASEAATSSMDVYATTVVNSVTSTSSPELSPDGGMIFMGGGGAWSLLLNDTLMSANRGGCVRVERGSLTFSAVRFQAWFNKAKVFGGIVYVAGELSNITLEGCDIQSNEATFGAVAASDGPIRSGAIVFSLITLCTAQQGTVLFSRGNVSNLVITDGSLVDRNTASQNGGVIFSNFLENVTVANHSNVTNNYANGDGGAFCVMWQLFGFTVANDSHVDSNIAYGAIGGAIWVAASGIRDNTYVAIDGVLVTNGSSMSYNSACKGGALGAGQGIRNVTVSLFSHMDHNAASNPKCLTGAATGSDGSNGQGAGNGGALHAIWGDIADITLTGNSSMSTNRAYMAGGAVTARTGSISRVVVAEGSSMSSNTAELGSGGAFYIPPDALGGTISAVQLLSGSHMDFNAAAEAGGVMAAGGIDDVTIDGASSMDRNRARTMGGALCATSGSLTRVTVSSGSSMDENLALESGGALAAPAGNISQLLVTGDSSVSRNTAQGGSGGALFAAQGGISDCSVQAGSRMSGNLAALDGGAAYAGAGIDGFRVGDGSRLDSNTAGSSGGVLYAAGNVSLAVSGSSTLSHNTAVQHGGAIYTNASVTAFEMSGSCNVSGNSARGNGGALYAAGSIEHLAVTGASSLLDNSASLQGGAIWAPIIVFMQLEPGCSVTGNSAGQAGGAISTGCTASVPSDWQVQGSNVSANRAGTSGGALYINGRSANPAELDAPQVAGSISLNASGAAFLQNQAAVSGGAIAQEGPLCRLAVSGGAFTRNAAGATGGAMAALAGGSIEASGVTVGPGNTADTGAGLFVGDAGTISVHGSSISGNTATSSGGGMAAQGPGSALTASSSQLGPNNRAAMGGGLFAGPASSVLVRGSNVSSNAASNRGGSVAAALCGSLRLYDSLVTGSTARSDGGGVSTVGCQLVHISGTRLQSNVAGRGGALFLGVPADTAGCGAGQDACMAIISGNSSMSGNIAAPSTDTAPGVPQGYGGAVFAEHVPGLILLVDSSTAFSLNNAWLGADVASLQTCATSQGGQEQQAAGTVDTAALCAQEALAAAGALSIAWSVPTSCASAVAGAANCSRALLAQDLLLSSRYTPGAATAISPAVSTNSVTFQIPIAQARPAWFADYGLPALSLLVANNNMSSSPKESLAGVEVPVAEARLDCTGGGGPCSWKSGDSLNATVAMYDVRGLPVSSVPSTGYTVTMSLVRSGSSSQAPWLVIGGKPTGPWSFTVGATARMALTGTAITGWPGTYTLELQSLPLEAATPLRNTSTSLRLQGCALGEFLDLPSPQPGTEDLYLRTCSRCPVQSVGLYEDPRLALDMAAAGASSDAALQTRKLALTRLASKMCLSCPDNAVCPRGLDMAPLPGYWHSSPRSPFMHACLYQAACSDASAPGVRAAAAALSNSAVVADLKLRLEDILGPLSNNRTLMLAALRQHVLTSGAAGAPRRSLSGSNSSNVTAIADYLQAQCAEGYTGNLCATCQPGYTLNSFFWCTECPSQSRTIVIGVFVLLCTVAMIILTAVENLSETEPEEQKPDDGHARAKKVRSIVPRDVLKVLVVHIQYYIVISRLNIPKPDLMAPVSAVLTAIIGAESLWSYSHACLLSDQDSAGQAHLTVLGALLTPCACLAMSLLLWALRYGIFNAARFYRNRMGDHHVNPMFRVEPLSLGEDGAEQGKPAPDKEAGSEQQAKDNGVKAESPDTSQQGDPSEGSSGNNGSPQRSPPTSKDDNDPADKPADPALPASNSIPTVLSSKSSNGSLGVSPFEKPKNQSLLDSQSSVDRQAQLISPSSSVLTITTSLGDKEQLGHALPAADSGVAAADAGAFPLSPFAQMYKKKSPPKPAAASLVDNAAASPSKRDPGVSPFAYTAAGPNHPAAMLLDDASSIITESSRDSGLESLGSTINSHGSGGPASSLPSVPTILEQRSSALSTALSSRMSSIRRQVSTASQKLEGLRDRSAAVSGLALVDRTLSLAQQLWIVAVIAVFVLFPSWASAAFSVFSCYTLDDASSGAEMQGLEFGVASYARGYWSRNMNQECYTDSHMGLYVPLGIVFVIIFCAGPPVYNLVTLWRVRDKLDDYQTQQVYGFMYSRYKAKFFWWDTVLLLETLALVAVDVFGGDLNVSYQALMLQLVLLLIAGINIVVEPIRSSTLRRIEFSSTSILAATIAFNMYYVVGSVTLVDEGGGAAIAIITIVINLSFIIALAVIAVLASKVDLKHLTARMGGCCGGSGGLGLSTKASVELQLRTASTGSVRSVSSPRSGGGFRARFAARSGSASGRQAPSRLKQSQLAVVSEVVVEE